MTTDQGYRRAITVRIRATGQVLEMVPDVAIAMINGGTATRVETTSGVAPEKAVTPAQSPQSRPMPSRRSRQ